MKKVVFISSVVSTLILMAVCGFFLLTQNTPTIDIIVPEEHSQSTIHDNFFRCDEDGNDIAMKSNIEGHIGNAGAMQSVSPSLKQPVRGTIIYDVVLMNFSDYILFNEKTFSDYSKKFEEVADYINNISRNNAKVKFNYYIYNNSSVSIKTACAKDANYSTEKNFIEQGLERGYCVSSCGAATGKILMAAFEGSFKVDSLAHPHVWYKGSISGNLMVVTSQSNTRTIAHELLHTMGLEDLYNYKLSFYCEDIMSDTPKTLPAPLNSYSRWLLGWLDESSVDDGINSGIETINSSGRFVVNDQFTQSGTISYKFGKRGGEEFYIEFAMQNSQYGTLNIYKVNKFYTGNYSASYESQLHIVTAHVLDGKYYNNNKKLVSPSENPLKYSDGTVARVSIGNIYKNDKNQVEFDLVFADNLNIDGEIVVLDKYYKEKISNAQIFINNEYFSCTNANGVAGLSASAGDVVDVVATGYTKCSYYVVANDYNYIDREFIVELVTENIANTNKYEFELFIKFLGSFYEISPFEVTFSINEKAIKYSKDGIHISPGDKLTILSKYNRSISYEFDSFGLHNGSEMFMPTGNTFRLILPMEYYSYYINLYNEQEDLAEISKIKMYNSVTNEWQELKSVVVYYHNQTPYYFIHSIPAIYTRIGFEYTACGTTSMAIVFLDTERLIYKQKLDKSAIQIVGNFVTTAGLNAIDFFLDLFKNILS